MSDNQRHRLFNEHWQELPAGAGSTAANRFEVGDMLWLDEANGIVKGVDQYTWDTSLAVTQQKAASRFAGVSAGHVLSTDVAGYRPVVQSGVVEMTCASATFRKGQWVGFAKQTGNALEPQKVAATSDPACAIGVVWQTYASATTTVLIVLLPRFGPFAFIPQKKLLHLGGRPDAAIVAGVNWVTDLTFNERVKLLRAIGIQGASAMGANASVVTFSNGANALDDTHSQTALAAAGTVVVTDFDDANDYDVFEPDDTLDVVAAACVAGTAYDLILEYAPLPGHV